MGWQGGGDSDFSCRGGGSTFCSRRGEGYLKIAKKSPKMHFLREFWQFVRTMCNFAFLRYIFFISTRSIGNFSCFQKGGQ